MKDRQQAERVLQTCSARFSGSLDAGLKFSGWVEDLGPL